MKRCLTCKSEYEDFATQCSDCGAILVSEEEFNTRARVVSQPVKEDSVQLVAVYSSTLESDILMITEFLEENGIVYEIKNEGIGSYLQIYGGVNYLGTSVCVSEEDAENAMTLIDAFWKDSESEVEEDRMEESMDYSFDASEESDESEEYRARQHQSMSFKRDVLKFFIFFILGSGLFFQVLSILR
ncbi:MAG: DUF2007 domain-containing protein [Firmicutes bacterium]|nr:DUF2007 domain-containing protein [Bacillota bacterium]